MDDGRRVGPASWILFWGIALGGAAFDLATKHLVFARMGVGEVKSVLDDVLEIQPSRNTGALWGFGSGLPYSSQLFAALSIFAGVAIVYWLFARGAARDLRYCVAFGLVMAGALGNCYDRLRYGYVRDFVHLHVEPIRLDFAIFNFADNMLVLGAIGLVLLALQPDDEPSAPEPEPLAAIGPDAAAGPAGQTS
jgi:signal peptidase II